MIIDDTKGQLTVWDFIDNPRSMLEILDFKVNKPLYKCVNCLCNYCVNNVESINVEQGEMLEACFACDYCCHFSGENKLCSMVKENCSQFKISNYEAQKKRSKLRIVGD